MALLNIVDNMNCWDTVTIIAKNLQEDLWRYKIHELEQMKKRHQIKWFIVGSDLESLPAVEDYDSALKNLVIIDDCCQETKTKLARLTNFYTFSRKFGCFLCFLTQSFFVTTKYFRDNTNYVILLADLSKKECRRVCAEFESRLAGVNEIVEMYNNAIQCETDWFLFDRSERTRKELKYRKCFG